MPDGIGRVFAGVYKALEVFEESAQKLIGDLQNALAELESEVGAETSRLKSQLGQSPEQDIEFKPADEEPINVEEEIELSVEEQEALLRASIEPIELRGTLAKYRTYYDEAQTEPRGWLLKLFDENDQETDDGNDWLCRVFIKWVQELPRAISSRDENNNRDRAYPAKSKRSIYVNDGEMAFVEELAKEQGVLVQEKEFNRQ